MYKILVVTRRIVQDRYEVFVEELAAASDPVSDR
jgi:hypothetical protein